MFNPIVNAPDEIKFFPKLNTLPNIPATCCVLPFFCRLGPIVRQLSIVTFDRHFFRLTLSYLAKKNLASGDITCFGVPVRLNNILSLYISSMFMSFTTEESFMTTTPNVSNIGTANAPVGKKPPFCLRLFRLHLYIKHHALLLVFSF